MDQQSLVEYLVQVLELSDEYLTAVIDGKALAEWSCGTLLPGVFVSEEGARADPSLLENIWFFSPTCVVGLSMSVGIDALRVLPIARIAELSLRAENYALRTGGARSKSKLNVELKASDAVVTLQATGSNCDRLKDIVETYLRPSLLDRNV